LCKLADYSFYTLTKVSSSNFYGGTMNQEILNSVIKITKNSDVESLEYSLVKTLIEFVGCTRISIFKDLRFFNGEGIEESLHLNVDKNQNETWFERRLVEEPSRELLSSFSSACSISVKNSHGLEMRWHPICHAEEAVGVIYIEVNELDSNKQVLVNAFCRIFENYLKVLNNSERDKLTGLLNRQTFELKINSLLKKQARNQYKENTPSNNRFKRLEASSWLAIIDVDHFKKVNDEFGHICGDEVLLKLSQKMQSFFRRSDLLFRFGGEEFVMVLGPTTLELAEAKIESFRKEIENTCFPLVNKLTISIGFSRISPHDFPLQILEQADKALYFAKDNGRNRVNCYETLVEHGEIILVNHKSDISLF